MTTTLSTVLPGLETFVGTVPCMYRNAGRADVAQFEPGRLDQWKAVHGAALVSISYHLKD